MGYFPELPPEYTGGLGKEGAAALKEFVERAGRSWPSPPPPST